MSYTVSGGPGHPPVTIDIGQLNGVFTPAYAIDPSLIAAIDAGVANGSLIAQYAPPDPMLPTPPLGGYVIIPNGGAVHAVGQSAIVASSSSAVTTVTGGGSDAQSVLSGTGSLVFTTSSGDTTVAAGGSGNAFDLLGGNNAVFANTLGTGPPDTIVAAAGVNVISAARDLIRLGSGTSAIISTAALGGDFFPASNTIVGGSGSSTIVGLGGDLIALGSGAASIESFMNDTIFAGSGSVTIGNLSTPQGNLVFGGSGRLLFISPEVYGVSLIPLVRPSTVLGGTGSATIFGAGVGPNAPSPNGLYAGGSAGNNVIVGSGNLIGSSNNDQLFAKGSASEGTILMAAGGGNETLSALFADTDVVMFGGNNTVDAAGATVTANDLMGGDQDGNQVFFAGTGNATMLGGTGSDLFAFVNGRAGGSDQIVGFTAQDHVSLQGYAPDAVDAALASATVASGSTAIVLSDHTTVTFDGVSNLTAASFG